METLEVHLKDYLIKWVHVPDNLSAVWQVQPTKKSINFAIYRKSDLTTAGLALLDDPDPREQQRHRLSSVALVNLTETKTKVRLLPLQLALQLLDLTLVKNYNKLVPGELVRGTLAVEKGGMLAFLFDNTFSKNTMKKVLFACHPEQGLTVHEPMQSVLLKKRRKKLQGFVKRHFVLDFRTGTLSYFKGTDNRLRGQMPVELLIITANERTREIFIDLGVEVWSLKALRSADFSAWVAAFNTVKSNKPLERAPADQGGLRAALAAIVEELPNLSKDDLAGRLAGLLALVEPDRLELVLLALDDFYDAAENLEGVVFIDGEKELDVDVALELELDEELIVPQPLVFEGAPLALYPLPHDPIRRNADIPVCTHEPPSLLLILRKNVGKDMLNIAMPVSMNEPLTVLQKYAEMLEYSEMVDNAVETADAGERLLRVAAFGVLYLSLLRVKVRNLRKPFNPMLGETYELVREDKGFRMVAEKVLHRPPVFALHAETADWTLSCTAAPLQKFWGKTYEITTKGTARLVIRRLGEVFTWLQPTSMLKNLLAGEKYTEPTLEMVVRLSLGARAVAEFAKGGMFSGRLEDVVIRAFDHGKNPLPQLVTGKWTQLLTLKDKTHEKVIWTAGSTLPKCEKKFGFTEFAGTLNKITPLEEGHLPPTDSRLRPDMQQYERGNVDRAEQLKVELEEAQRARRKHYEDTNTLHTPAFFVHEGDAAAPDSGDWVFREGPDSYWNCRHDARWDTITKLW